MNNRNWTDKLIQRFDPTFKQRWDAYDELICSFMTHESMWIDIGCGENLSVEVFGQRSNFAVGLDQQLPKRKPSAPFVCADIRYLPFFSGSFDLVTLRFVVEHLLQIPENLADITRILKPKGYVIIITTNLWSPFVFMAQLLPARFKRKLLRSLYKVRESEILPTYHQLNTPNQMKKGIHRMKLIRLEYVQGASFIRWWLFLLFFFWYLITRIKFLERFRDNLLAVYQQSS